MRIHYFIATAVVVATSSEALAATDYGAAGPETVLVSDLPANAGGSTGGKLVVPSGAGPYPLIVASHGWSGSADTQVGWAKQFASWGFVVVVPSFPNPLSPDTPKDVAVIEALVTMYSSPPAGSPAVGKVDRTRIALEGFSAGGLATTIATKNLKPMATVLFDPVDKDDVGKANLPSVCGPLLEIFTEPSSCNATGNWTAFKATSSGPSTLFKIAGANHCDGENTARAICALGGCGGSADAGRQTLFSRYATAFLLAHVKGDTAAAAAVNEATLRANAALVDVAVSSNTSCVTAPGGGTTGGGSTTTGGGGTTTGPTTGGGATTTGGGSSTTTGGGSGTTAGATTGSGSGTTGGGSATGGGSTSSGDTPGDDGGEAAGCATSATRPAPTFSMFAGVAAVVALVRRRRRATARR